MRQDELYDNINQIHDEVIQKLKIDHIAPYPNEYKLAFDALFQSLDNSLKLKSGYSPNGFHDNIARHLDLAHRTIMAFIESHNDISHIANLQYEYLTQGSRHHGERCSEMVQTMIRMGEDMSYELRKSQSRIETLNLELKEALEAITTDPLTQVSNRKGMSDDLEHFIQAGEKQSLPFVLMMFDADNFKLLNDRFGHLAGDKVLVYLAQTIRSMIRNTDRVYRYGGEEFAVVLNRCDPEQAFEIADKIRSKIEQSQLIYNGQAINLTVSVGVTAHRQGDTIDSLIARADEALYKAKNSDKNLTILS